MTPELDLTPGRPAFNIIRPAHVEFRVTDLGRARDYYVQLLGFVESGSDRDRLYLRGYEERDHHSLVLRRAPSPGAAHLTYRVAAEDDLDRLEHLAARDDLPRGGWRKPTRAGRCVSRIRSGCRWSSCTRSSRPNASCSATISIAAPS